MGFEVVSKPSTTYAFSPYRAALSGLNERRAPYLVGGTYAFAAYTQIARPTKDLDLFVMRRGPRPGPGGAARPRLETELAFPHWLGKARLGGHSIDIIYSSGNGIATVDDEWFAHARPATVLGVRARCPRPRR